MCCPLVWPRTGHFVEGVQFFLNLKKKSVVPIYIPPQFRFLLHFWTSIFSKFQVKSHFFNKWRAFVEEIRPTRKKLWLVRWQSHKLTKRSVLDRPPFFGHVFRNLFATTTWKADKWLGAYLCKKKSAKSRACRQVISKNYENEVIVSQIRNLLIGHIKAK